MDKTPCLGRTRHDVLKTGRYYFRTTKSLPVARFARARLSRLAHNFPTKSSLTKFVWQNTYWLSHIRPQGKVTDFWQERSSFRHFATIFRDIFASNWKSRDYAQCNDVITNGKKKSRIYSHACRILCTDCKNMAQSTTGGFVKEMFLILAIILATEGTFFQRFRQVK